MSFKAGFNQITLFLRKTVGLCLAALLCFELVLGWIELTNPILRFALTLPLASWGMKAIEWVYDASKQSA